MLIDMQVEDPDLDREVFIQQNPDAAIFYSGSLFKEFKFLAAEVFGALLNLFLINISRYLKFWISSLKIAPGIHLLRV